MDKANEVIEVSEQKTPFHLLPQEEQQRILDANQKRVREAPTLHEWDIRVPEAYAWIMISIVVGTMMLLFGGGSVYATDGNDWSLFYIVLGVSILMTFFLRFLVMADKDYHYRLTTEGVIVTYQEVIPEVAYTIVRGLAWFGVVVCVLAVALLGPLALVGAGGMALLAIFFTDFKSEVSEHETMFKKDWDYTLLISNKKNALRFESTPFKISYSDNVYCNHADFEKSC
jgi:protein-S-isoprenylcysteine O-methyltransferase Ste14